MPSLTDALAYALSRSHLPVWVSNPPVSLAAVGMTLGLPPPFSLKQLIETLLLPGNFLPGQPLDTGVETRGPDWFQADVFAIGLGGTPWKFWEFNDGPWMNGVIRNEALTWGSVPLTVTSFGNTVLIDAPAYTEDDLARFSQDPEGKWSPFPVRIDHPIPSRSKLVTFYPFAFYAVVAVDNDGTVRLFLQEAEESNPTLPLTGVALSDVGFAPPGAPVVVDIRRLGLSDGIDQGGDLDVFVVNNEGQLWVFGWSGETYDLQTGWTGLPMPNPRGINLQPGTHLATGYQVALESVGAGSNSLGYCQLDVFAVDANGDLQIWWESQGSEWHQDTMPDGSGLPPGAPIATGLQVYELPWKNTPIGNQLDVFVAGVDARVSRWWVYRSGSWNHDFLPDQYPVPAAAHLATAHQKIDGDGRYFQLDVFAVGPDGRIVVFWQTQGFQWDSEIMPGSDLPTPPPPM